MSVLMFFLIYFKCILFVCDNWFLMSLLEMWKLIIYLLQ